MMGRTTLSEVKAKLGLLGTPTDGSPAKTKPTAEGVELEKILTKALDELEREVKKRRKPKVRPSG